ncbi:uncharacterized protein LOC123875304 [Maniola jurtina]|uniref:uncharacterized protein LOC123875304 n=1 Tax=Maniola jurtina TaxID=191418 RepID=UPI001E68BE74|nr:uncharacterized protein LOC123875304 [Maniola jurtina]
MKLFLILLGLGVAAGVNYDGLRVTYGPLKNIKEFFFNIPRTIEDAIDEGWCKTERPPGPLEQLELYCSPGYYVCLLFTPCGMAAGLQLAFPAEDLITAVIDKNKWFTDWYVPTGDGEPAKKYLALSQYWVSEEFLAAGGPTVENGSTLQDDGIWVYNHSGELMLIPKTEAEINCTTKFTKQNCTPRMGTHYHYNMTREMLCENQLPWFALTIQGELIGSGLQFFGDLTKSPPYREWFEKFGGRNVERGAVPFGPPCLYDLADAYPIFSLHIYYIDNPDSIKCRREDSADPSTTAEYGHQ